jgi:hypothetical protein
MPRDISGLGREAAALCCGLGATIRSIEINGKPIDGPESPKSRAPGGN